MRKMTGKITTHAVILAAGMGIRLLPYTERIPKCLIKVNDIPIIVNILNALHSIGVSSVKIIVGHLSENIMREIGPIYRGIKIKYIVNEQYKSTNSMYSLYLGIKELRRPTWVIEGDVFFEEKLITLDHSAPITWFADSSVKEIDGAYLETDKNYRVLSLNILKETDHRRKERFKSVGVVHLDIEAVAVVEKWLKQGIDVGRKNDYYDLILGDHFNDIVTEVRDVKGFKWFEIDNEDDLKKAREIFK